MLFFSHFEGTRGEKNIIVNFIIKNQKVNTLSSKIYKLGKNDIFFSYFEGTRGEFF